MAETEAAPAPELAAPAKVMSWEEFYEVTDNANALMDRVWYCIACSDAEVGNQKVFWEHWYWKDETEGPKAMDSYYTKTCSNHTKTIAADGKEVDYPLWPVTFTTESMTMYPAIDMGCCVIAPLGVSMKPVAFPTKDSKKEFRVDYGYLMGKHMYFVFVLDPLISEADKAKEFEKLETESGIKKDWFHMVQWDPEYKVASTGEPDINP
jgi:hypothetical protein